MRWPVGKFAEISRWLRDTHGIASVVNLSAQEEAIAAQVRNEMRGSAVVPEGFDLRELIALVAGSSLFVGNDSGPAHLAAATGSPAVVIYGSTNPAQWRPWGTEHRVVETGAKFRAVRGDKTIVESAPRRIEDIGVEEVRAACEELLSAKSGNSRVEDAKGIA
jgi:heptosyltransferase-2/heptosyltransferase-3